MREIKFRAWDNEEKNFIYFDCINGLLSQCDNQYYKINIKHIEQFTGLHDKNGKEIYEGDICKYYQPYAKKWDLHYIKWDYMFACFGFYSADDPKWCKESDWLKVEEVEIIGNIHETPELLENT